MLEKNIYISYSKESTTFFKCTFDEELWEYMWIHLKEMYDVTDPKKPVHLNCDVLEIKKKLKDYIQKHVNFPCELPSIMGKCNDDYIPDNIINPFICPTRSQQRMTYDE